MNWYRFNPVDTLFFRGAEPMNIGENHTAVANFPPPAQTLAGALRTAVLVQNGISLTDYYANHPDADLRQLIGPAGEPPGFDIIGPLFQHNAATFVPAPYSWFMEKEEKEASSVKVYKSFRLNSELIKTSGAELAWAKGDTGVLASLGGKWIDAAALHAAGESVTPKETSAFFEIEARTGIALARNRSVREGHLYSFNHSRLNRGVSIVFGVDKDLPLAKTGVLKLGAEQRFGAYRSIPPIRFGRGGSGCFLSLSMVAGSQASNAAVIATGKIQYIGGWDLKKGFHKPMQGYFASGSVFSRKINENFIEL